MARTNITRTDPFQLELWHYMAKSKNGTWVLCDGIRRCQVVDVANGVNIRPHFFNSVGSARVALKAALNRRRGIQVLPSESLWDIIPVRVTVDECAPEYHEEMRKK